VTEANVFVTQASAAIAGNAENTVEQWIEGKLTSSRSIGFGNGTHPLARRGIRLSERAPFVMPFLIEQVLDKRRQVLHFRSQISRPYRAITAGAELPRLKAWVCFPGPSGRISSQTGTPIAPGEVKRRIGFGVRRSQRSGCSRRSRRSLPTSHFSLFTAHQSHYPPLANCSAISLLMGNSISPLIRTSTTTGPSVTANALSISPRSSGRRTRNPLAPNPIANRSSSG
jgi:hypothetical protein